MKTLIEMQKKVRVLTLCGAAAASAAMFWSCSGVGASTESFKRSDYFTRGIGQYPGNPSEDFSPELLPDNSTYRNIALLRSAYQSSSYDYNLVAQLVTDGIITKQQHEWCTFHKHKQQRFRRWCEGCD